MAGVAAPVIPAVVLAAATVPEMFVRDTMIVRFSGGERDIDTPWPHLTDHRRGAGVRGGVRCHPPNLFSDPDAALLLDCRCGGKNLIRYVKLLTVDLDIMLLAFDFGIDLDILLLVVDLEIQLTGSRLWEERD